jgi:hypothetical protein
MTMSAALAAAIVGGLFLLDKPHETIFSAWSWLFAPVSGKIEHDISTGVTWHGRLMVLAWAILMPAAFVVARFYKIMPGQDWPRRLDNPFWFVSHRRLGYAIFILTIAAISILVWSRSGMVSWHGHHAIAGWTVFAFSLFQIVGALLRGSHGGPVDPFTRKARPPEQWPGDHFSLTRRRIFFEYSHKLVGYVLAVLAAWTIASGLHAVDAPRWMWLGIGVWTLMCIYAFVRLQRSGKCIDTYQAIWGLDETLPGYRHKPIGWGITRVKQNSKPKK